MSGRELHKQLLSTLLTKKYTNQIRYVIVGLKIFMRLQMLLFIFIQSPINSIQQRPAKNVLQDEKIERVRSCGPNPEWTEALVAILVVSGPTLRPGRETSCSSYSSRVMGSSWLEAEGMKARDYRYIGRCHGDENFPNYL